MSHTHTLIHPPHARPKLFFSFKSTSHWNSIWSFVLLWFLAAWSYSHLLEQALWGYPSLPLESNPHFTFTRAFPCPLCYYSSAYSIFSTHFLCLLFQSHTSSLPFPRTWSGLYELMPQDSISYHNLSYHIIRSNKNGYSSSIEVDWDRGPAWAIITSLLIPCETSGWNLFWWGSCRFATISFLWVNALPGPSGRAKSLNKLFTGTLVRLHQTHQSPKEHNLKCCLEIISGC